MKLFGSTALDVDVMHDYFIGMADLNSNSCVRAQIVNEIKDERASMLNSRRYYLTARPLKLWTSCGCSLPCF